MSDFQYKVALLGLFVFAVIFGVFTLYDLFTSKNASRPAIESLSPSSSAVLPHRSIKPRRDVGNEPGIWFREERLERRAGGRLGLYPEKTIPGGALSLRDETVEDLPMGSLREGEEFQEFWSLRVDEAQFPTGSLRPDESQLPIGELRKGAEAEPMGSLRSEGESVIDGSLRADEDPFPSVPY